MKHMKIDKTRLDRLIAAFNLLCENDQIYIENLTSQLAKTHKTAPETRRLSGKGGKT